MINFLYLPSILILVGIVGKIILMKNKDSLCAATKKNITLFYIIASFSILVDYYTKVWAEYSLEDKKIPILGEYLYFKN